MIIRDKLLRANKITSHQSMAHKLFIEPGGQKLLESLREHYYDAVPQPQTAIDIARWKGGLDVITDMLKTVRMVQDLIKREEDK